MRATKEEVEKLLDFGFIEEAKYTTRLSNVIMVKKQSRKWRMCTDYTDLENACLKDTYRLPSIDRLMDKAAGQKILSFLYAYSSYNQIWIHHGDKENMTFMTNEANFFYEVISFDLKNAGATYQRRMDKVF